MRVLALSADPASTLTQVRVSGPLQGLLAAQGGTLELRPLHDTPSSAFRGMDVVIVERGMSRRHLDLMTTAAARGCAVIYEIDDLLTEPVGHLQHVEALRQGQRWIRAALEMADVVTVSTPRLAQLLSLPAERHVVVPNAAFDGQVDQGRTAAPKDTLSVLVAASDRVAGSMAWQALRELQAEAGGTLAVLAVGPVAEDLVEAGVSCIALPTMPREVFVPWAASQPNPVAVIPLDDSRFSAGKSAVKWFDYAVAGVVTLASDVPPYRDVMAHDRNGWLVGPTLTDWRQALATALTDGDARARLAREARRQVLAHHHIGITRQAWAQALQTAMARAAERRGQPGRRQPVASWRQVAQDLTLSFRRWNRARLANRKPPG